MAFFALIRATTSGEQTRLRQASIPKACREVLPFTPEAFLEIQVGPAEWLAAYAVPTAFYSANEQIHHDPETGAVTILHGFCWKRGGAHPLSARDLHAAIDPSREGVIALRTSLIGEYVVLHVSPTRTAVAFSDNLAISPLYHGEHKDKVSIANRLELAAALAGGNPGPNRSALAELAVIGYRLSRETANQGMQIVFQNEHVVWEPDAVKVERYRCPLFLENLDPDGAFAPDRLDAAIEETFASLRVLVSRMGSLRIALTGGRDSRLVLSLAIAAGLKDRIETFTNGDARHFDAIIAKQVAAAAGVPHRIVTPQRPALGTEPVLSPEAFFHRLALHTARVEGSVGAWDMVTTTRLGKNVVLQGTAGEILKHFIKTRFAFEPGWSAVDVVRLYHPFDPLGIVDPEVKQRLSELLESELSAAMQEGFEPPDTADLFYSMFRMPGWLGGMQKGSSYARAAVSPLNSPLLISLAFSAGYKQRKILRPHYELIRRTCPQLLSIPLGGDSWSEELRAYGAPDDMFSPPCTSVAAVPVRGSWQHTLNKSGLMRAQISEFVRSNASDPLFEVIDFKRLLHAIESGPLALHGMISLFGALVALARSSGFETRYPLGKQTERLRYVVRGSNGGSSYDVKFCEYMRPSEQPAAAPDIEISPAVESTFLRAADAAFNPDQEGFVTEITSHAVRGWAFVPAYPYIRSTVEVMHGQNLVARGCALIFSADLKQAGKGDGRHGFLIPINLPEGVEKQPIWARFTDTKKAIPPSPELSLALLKEPAQITA